jgi:hypothetical protein
MYQIDVTTDRISTGIRPDFMGGLPARNRFKAIRASAAERRFLEFHKKMHAACETVLIIRAIMSAR